MKKEIKLEVEGGELGIRNSYGDVAIIPKKHKEKIENMIKNKCWDCIDSFVDTLPIMADYAQDGSVIKRKSTRQLWEEETGLDWSVAKKEGLTDGSYENNIKLRNYLINKNYSKYDMAKIAPRNGVNIYKDEKGNNWEESYKMAWSEKDNKYYAYPTIFQNKDGTWDLENPEPLEEAIKRGEAVEFYNKYDAAIFAANAYKKYSPSLKKYFKSFK
jgi:hypothetical protein